MISLQYPSMRAQELSHRISLHTQEEKESKISILDFFPSTVIEIMYLRMNQNIPYLKKRIRNFNMLVDIFKEIVGILFSNSN